MPSTPTPSPRPTPSTEQELLADALEVAVDELELISREPLGAGSVAGFHAPGGPGHDRLVSYVDTSRLAVPQETGLVLEGTARVWMHPADPYLPALAPVAFGHAAEILLGRLGLAATGEPRLVAYRPGRRAVVAVPTALGTTWIKVVRPDRLERIVQTHAAFAAAGLPVPVVRGWAPDGLLVTDSAVGTPATEQEWEADHLLDQVERLRAELAGAALPRRARGSIARRRPWYVERLTGLLPHADVPGISERIGRLEGEAGETRGIHGDLHIGQLFLAPDGTVSGIIDVDTAGTGDPAEDAAAFLAHAVASALLTTHPEAAARVHALADGAQRRWAGAARVRGLAAVHLIGHALGAAEAGHADRARRLVAAARACVDGDPVTSVV